MDSRKKDDVQETASRLVKLLQHAELQSNGADWCDAAAALVAYVSDLLVGTLEGASDSWGVSTAFVSAILVPIAGNAAEHTSALIFAYKNRLDLALGICVGSAVQIFAFVMPLMVVAGWIGDRPMSLDLKPFEFGALFFSVLMIGGESASRRFGVPQDFVLMLVGLLLVFLALVEYLDHLRRKRAGV